MAYFIIIRGPLGIGKTIIAKKLAEVLKAKYMSVDKILEKQGLDKVEGECIPIKNFIKVNKITLSEVRDKISPGKIVILYGNFYHKEQIEHLIKNLDISTYVFTLKAPVDICLERDKNRKFSYGKSAAVAVHKLVSRFDYGTLIDTKDKYAEQVIKEISSYLPK